jgi:hypothetical protein
MRPLVKMKGDAEFLILEFLVDNGDSQGQNVGIGRSRPLLNNIAGVTDQVSLGRRRRKES